MEKKKSPIKGDFLLDSRTPKMMLYKSAPCYAVYRLTGTEWKPKQIWGKNDFYYLGISRCQIKMRTLLKNFKQSDSSALWIKLKFDVWGRKCENIMK